jgi:glutamyl-Q tRNA(Asp) synthetase
MAEYQAALDHLSGMGLLYPCFCTRTDILAEVSDSAAAPHAPDGSLVYPGTCRGLTSAQRSARIEAGERFALRLDMTAALRSVGRAVTFHEDGEGIITCHPERFGDVVLGRKETPASYHLCVTHDDALQGVTLVTRGEDLKPATDVHRVLQALMGWPAPAYAHHPLLRDAHGRRLAKRDQDATLRDLRAVGATPAEVLARAAL